MKGTTQGNKQIRGSAWPFFIGLGWSLQTAGPIPWVINPGVLVVLDQYTRQYKAFCKSYDVQVETVNRSHSCFMAPWSVTKPRGWNHETDVSGQMNVKSVSIKKVLKPTKQSGDKVDNRISIKNGIKWKEPKYNPVKCEYCTNKL